MCRETKKDNALESKTTLFNPFPLVIVKFIFAKKSLQIWSQTSLQIIRRNNVVNSGIIVAKVKILLDKTAL